MPSIAQVLAALGAFVLLKTLYSALRLAAIYTGGSNVRRYVYGDAPYALVTGATDGIGKAVAKELYLRGFNLILHGRNANKLERVSDEIRSAGSTKKDVRLWVADANSADVDFEGAAKQWDGLQITLVVHNVGGAPVRETTIDGIPTSDLVGDVRRNALFPLLLTRALLPQLRRVPGPVEIVFTGSLSSRLQCPRIVAYAASKAFLRQLIEGLASDELFRAQRTPNVAYLYADVGSVSSASHRFPPSFGTPAAADFAKHFVNCIGCGRRYVIPYWPHALQVAFTSLLPDSAMLPALFKAMEAELDANKKD